jgi:hypothetical protein
MWLTTLFYHWHFLLWVKYGNYFHWGPFTSSTFKDNGFVSCSVDKILWYYSFQEVEPNSLPNDYRPYSVTNSITGEYWGATSGAGLSVSFRMLSVEEVGCHFVSSRMEIPTSKGPRVSAKSHVSEPLRVNPPASTNLSDLALSLLLLLFCFLKTGSHSVALAGLNHTPHIPPSSSLWLNFDILTVTSWGNHN